jgi:uncharacterized protein (TIGR00255 family)
MIKSMTGFGKHITDNAQVRTTIEIKSLNSKMLDINCRLPLNYKEYEIDIRNLISAELVRGKIDCIISSESKTAASAAVINPQLAQHYHEQFKTLSKNLGLKSEDEMLSNVLRMPDIFLSPEIEVSEEEWVQLKEGILQATAALDSFRRQEGKTLEADFRLRINEIIRLLEKIDPFEAERAVRVKERIRLNLNHYLQDTQTDENRLEQEMIFYIEKLDITEEKIRLKKHCEYFLETLDKEEAPGKKLGFICQEIGREINTLGSKANDVDIQKIVVLMKDELEKIKEQLFNIL